MSKTEPTHECPFKVSKRMEKLVLGSCVHPALKNPFRYSFEPERHLVLLILILLTGYFSTENHLFEPETVSAPSFHAPNIFISEIKSDYHTVKSSIETVVAPGANLRLTY